MRKTKETNIFIELIEGDTNLELRKDVRHWGAGMEKGVLGAVAREWREASRRLWRHGNGGGAPTAAVARNGGRESCPGGCHGKERRRVVPVAATTTWNGGRERGMMHDEQRKNRKNRKN
jgi:hypothetical protein